MNELNGTKVLVIGGAGFIGCEVVNALLREEVGEVVVFDNFSRGKLENLSGALLDKRCSIFSLGGDVRETDVLDAAMKGVDYVFHLAALWLLHCKDFPRAAFDVNVAGTFNVLEACVRHKVKKLVYSSSASVYGDAVEVPMTESHPFNNQNFYGATKISGESMCTAFADRYGLDVVGLRYMNVYGPRQDQKAVYSGVIPILMNKIDAGEALTVNGDGTQAYDFIYVDDVARANVCALKSETANGYFNVGTGVQTTIKSLCETILRLKRSGSEIEYAPYTADDARQFVQNRIGCPKAAGEKIGFSYRYSLEEGLQKLIDWRDACK